MNNRIMKKIQKIAINTERLTDNRELYPIEWLLKPSFGSGYFTNIDLIKDAILYMDKDHPNYKNLSEEDKIKVEELIQHPEIVDRVLVTTFQWFGTNVGKHSIGTLLDEIRNLGYMEIKSPKG